VGTRAGQLLRSPAPWAALALVLLALAAGLLAARSLAELGSEPEAPPRAAAGDPELEWFGFNELRWATEWQHGPAPDTDAQMRRSIEATAAAGANTDRLPVPWTDVVDASGGWDEEAWSRYRDAYREMVADGISPVIVLLAAPRGGVDEINPDWSPPGCSGGLASPPDPAHDVDWAAYVVRASNEFDHALALQVWNEPNSRDFWGGPGCAPDPARYVQLAALARTALASPGSEHPDRALVSAGLNPSTVPGSIPWDEYLSATLDDGLLEQVQAIGVHLYSQRRACGSGTDLATAAAANAARQLDQAAALVPDPTPLWGDLGGLRRRRRVRAGGARDRPPARRRECRVRRPLPQQLRRHARRTRVPAAQAGVLVPRRAARHRGRLAARLLALGFARGGHRVRFRRRPALALADDLAKALVTLDLAVEQRVHDPAQH